jgi:hypothetical protein
MSARCCAFLTFTLAGRRSGALQQANQLGAQSFTAFSGNGL